MAEYGDDGRLVAFTVEREPRFDAEQYEHVAALYEYEADLGAYGELVSEATSIDADPDNPKGKIRYTAEPVRNWAEYAVELESKKPEWSGDNYLRSRRWRVQRVERA